MSSGVMPRVAGLKKILDRCQRLIRVYSALRGLAETLCVIVACVLFVCLLDYLIPLPGMVRMTGLVATVVLTAGVVWKRLLQPLRSDAPAEELGAAVDLRFPELHEAIATLISIDSPTATSSESGSALMRDRLEQSVRSQIGSILPSDVVPGTPTVKRWGLATISVLAILIPLVLWPSGSQLLLLRFALPFANLAAPSNLYFEIPDGNRTVAVNSDVQFVAIPRWRTSVAGKLPQDVVAEMQVQGRTIEDLPMNYDEATSQFSAVLADIRNSVRYRVRAGRAATEWFEMTVADPPRILMAVLKATPPKYSGRAAEMFDGVVGDIHVFEHSEVEINLTFSKSAQNVEMGWKSWTPIAGSDVNGTGANKFADADTGANRDHPAIPTVLSADGKSARFEFHASGSGQFEFLVEDAVGLTNLHEPTRRLIVTTDTPPRLTVTGISDGLEVRSDDVLSLNCTATDDVGVGELELSVQKNGDVPQIEPAAGIHRGALQVTHGFQIDMKARNVREGDTLTIKVKAADERPIPRPQVVWQGPWTIHISDNAEAIGRKALREADQKLIESLRTLEEQLEQDAKKAEELKEKLTQELKPDTRQSVRDLSEKEQTQGRKLQGLAEETATHPLMKSQAEKLTELAQQIRQEIPAKLDAAATAEQAAATEGVEQSAKDLNAVREELHRATDEIEKAARLEQELTELNRLALEAQQLANDSQKLQEQRKDHQPKEGQSQDDLRKELDEIQKQLQQEQQDLTADLGSLLQRQQELLLAAREAQLDRAAALADQAKKLAQQQQQLAEGVTEEAAEKNDGAGNESAGNEDANRKSSESDVGQKLLAELTRLADAAQESADSVQADNQAAGEAKQQAKQASEKADEALRSARAGQFRRSAESMREAAKASAQAAEQMQDDVHEDRRRPLQQQQDSFNRMSEVVQQLQGNDEVQAAAQQATQGQVAQAARQLPSPLEELAERMDIPELGLQNQARPAKEAAHAAREGSESGEAASKSLEKSELQQASQEASKAADQLNAAAELAQQAAQGHRDSNSQIPKEVGENVGEALHSLKKAAEALNEASQSAAEAGDAQQSDAEGSSENNGPPGAEQQSDTGEAGQQEATGNEAGQPGENQAGQGQAGEGKNRNGQQPSSAQQLAKAAKSLQAAARGALPNQFSPGQLSSDPSSDAGEPSAEGNVSEFDGQNPDPTRKKGQRRQWGGLNDGLDADVSDSGKESLDKEYSELIRRYRRELARAGQKPEVRGKAENE